MIAFLAPFLSIVAGLSGTGMPPPGPTPNGPVYVGNPAAHMMLESRPLGFDPDGYARWAVVVHFTDAQNHPTRILLGSDLDYVQNHGSLQWQTRMRYGQPAAIVKTTDEGPLSLSVKANIPVMPGAAAETDTRTWRAPRVIAGVLGPHLVQIGWFPRETHAVTIARTGGSPPVAINVAAPSSTVRDTSVLPGKTYTYVVLREGKPPVRLAPVHVPSAMPNATTGALRGKGMWLSFSINPAEDGYYGKIDPAAIVERAASAGLHYVELRMAYGEFWEVSPQAKPVIDAIIDGLAAHHIGTIGWTVPREATFSDLALSVKTARYRTARGTPLAGLAVDLERGAEFMLDCPQGCIAIGDYTKRLRQAVGPNYPLIATIEDPYLEHLDNAKYPYPAVARSASVLQPMIYWWAMSKSPPSSGQLENILDGAARKVRALSGRSLPLSIGAQTSRIGLKGSPPGEQITASLTRSKTLGALGVCFFDWADTNSGQWDAIANFTW